MDATGYESACAVRKAAEAALAQARKTPNLKHYTQLVRQISAVFHRHGLGQTLAYLKMQGGEKANSPSTVLAQQMDGWLREATGVNAPIALAALTARDSGFYLEAAEQTCLFLRTLGNLLESGS